MATTTNGSQAAGQSGRFETIAALEKAHAELLRLHRGGAEDPEFRRRIRPFLQQAQAMGTLLDNASERMMAQSLLNYWANLLYRLEGEAPVALLEEFDPLQAPSLDDALCPYLTIESLAADSNGVFAAWRRLADEMLAELRQHHLVCLVGSASTGRTSFLQRALLPALESAEADSPGERQTPKLFSPGGNPLTSLAKVLWPELVEYPQQLQERIRQLRDDPDYLATVVDAGSQRVVLVIDQFEEVFTECTDAAERRALADNLYGLVKASSLGRVVLTVNRAFLGRMQQLGALDELVRRAQVRAVFTAPELREAIVRPANQVGLKFDDGVVDRLVLNTQGESAALSLLQFTLLRLWEYRDRNRITWEAYKKVGAGGQALERAADALYAQLSRDGRGTLRQILLMLVRPAGGRDVVLRLVSRQQMVWANEPAERVDRVLGLLVASRLVRQFAEKDKFAIACEALVDYWAPLIEWLEEESVKQRQRLRLTADARQWSETDDPNLLWRGLSLNQALEWKVSDPLEQEFVAASQAAVDASRRRTLLLMSGLTVFFFLLFLMAAFFAWLANSRGDALAQSGRQLANALGQRFVADGTALMNQTGNPRSGDYGGALLWTVEALELGEDIETLAPGDEKVDDARAQIHRIRLNAALQQWPRLQHMIYFEGNASPDFNSKGDLVVSACHDSERPDDASTADSKKLCIWTTESDEPVATATSKEPITQVIFKRPATGESELIAVAAGKGSSGVASVWRFSRQTGDLEEIWNKRFPAAVTSVVFSNSENDQRLLVVAENDQTRTSLASIFDTTSHDGQGMNLADPKLGDQISIEQAAFGPGGQRALTVTSMANSGSSAVEIWDTATGKPVTPPLKHEAPITRAVFSPDGKRVATVAEDGLVRLFDARTGVLQDSIYHTFRPMMAVFTPDSRLLITATDDGLVQVWHTESRDTQTGRDHAVSDAGQNGSHKAELISTLEHAKTTIYDAVVSPDSRWLVTCSRDRAARIWDLASGQLAFPPLHHSRTVNSAIFNADGFRLLTVDANKDKRSVRVWELSSGNPFPLVADVALDVQALALSDDGRFVGIGGTHRGEQTGSVQVWETSTGSPIGSKQWGKHPTPVKLIALSPNGQQLLTVAKGQADGAQDSVRIWDVGSDQATAVSGSFGIVNTAILSADGRRAALASNLPDEKGATISLIDMVRRESISFPIDYPVSTMAFDPSGRLLAIGGGKNAAPASGLARVYSVEQGTYSVEQEKWSRDIVHLEPITHLEFSVDGTYLVTGSVDDTARVWDTKSGNMKMKVEHTANVTWVTVSPDERLLLSASMDQTAVISDIAANAALTTLDHTGFVNQALFSPTGELALTVSNDGAARLWVAKTGDLVAVLPHIGSIEMAAFANVNSVVTAGYRSVSPLTAGVSDSRSPDVNRRAQVATWDIQPLSEQYSLAEIETLVEVISARQTKKTDGVASELRSLEPEETVARWQKLEKAVRAPISQGPARPAAASVAQQCETLGQWFAAHWYLERALQDSPDDPVLYARRARARVELGMPNEAMEDYRVARERGSASGELWAGLSRAHIALKHWEEAIQTCTEGLQHIAADAGGNAALKFELLARRAVAYHRSKQWELAAADYSAALQLKSLSEETKSLWEQRHEVYVRAGKSEELSQLYAQAIQEYQQHPLQWWLQQQLAQTYEAQGQWETSAAVYTEAIADQPDNPLPLEARARTLVEAGDLVGAAADLQKIVQLMPDYARGRYMLAVVHRAGPPQFEDGQYSQNCREMLDWFNQLDWFATLNDLQTTNVVVWTCCLGPDAVSATGYEQLINLAEMSAAAQPGTQHLQNTLGAILFRAGRYEEAIHHLHESRWAYARPAWMDNVLPRGLAQQPLSKQVVPLEPLDELPTDEGTIWDFLFLAMAHQGLAEAAAQRGDQPLHDQHHSEARKWLAQATTLYNSTPSDSPESNPDPYVRLETDLLMREAREAVGDDAE